MDAQIIEAPRSRASAALRPGTAVRWGKSLRATAV